MRKNIHFWRVLAIFAGFILVVSAFFLAFKDYILKETIQLSDNDIEENPVTLTPVSGENDTETEADEVYLSDQDNEPPVQDDVSEDENEDYPVTYIDNPYKDYFLENSDMVAWINIPDNTKIDYPVMWTPEDENYYLHRSFEKEELYEGCLILDTDSKAEPATTNLIIHGHNMRSGSMFGELDKYSDEDYCKEHDTIYLFTESEKRSYKVMAVFKSAVYKKSDTRFKYYKFFNADTEEQFNDFYNNVKDMSLYDTGVTASFGDRFLTLSTCSKHVENGRFVVVAKETESEACYNSFR